MNREEMRKLASERCPACGQSKLACRGTSACWRVASIQLQSLRASDLSNGDRVEFSNSDSNFSIYYDTSMLNVGDTGTVLSSWKAGIVEVPHAGVEVEWDKGVVSSIHPDQLVRAF